MKNVKECSIYIKICILLLGFLFFPTFISSTLFIFNISIGFLTFPISILILLLLYFIIFYNKNDVKSFYLPLLISILIIVFNIIISAFLYEFSWDGWAYHAPAIIKLKDGWNPIYQHIEEYGIWCVHYPKFIWIYSATLYRTFGNLFLGTSFNSMLMFSMFFMMIDILKKMKFSKFLVISLSLILSFNVITIGQIFSYYNDGVLGNCVICLLILFYAISKKYYQLNNNYIILFLIVVYSSILANIKFTGALFAFLIILIYFVFLWIKQIIKINKFTIVSLVSIALGVLIVGLNTYLPNILYHHNIGYPLMGEGKQDIITGLTPTMFANENKYLSFVKSITYDSNYNYYKYKPFYIIDEKALELTPSTDCRIGGFGPFFQLILLGSIFILFVSLIKKIIRSISDEVKPFEFKTIINELLIILILLILVIITPATWWARYVPYLYSTPLLLLIIFKRNWKKYDIETIMSYVIIVIYLISIPIYMYYKFDGHYSLSKKMNAEINHLKEISEWKVVNISFYNYKDLWYKEKVRNEILKINKINYIEHENDECRRIINYEILGVSLVDCTKK